MTKSIAIRASFVFVVCIGIGYYLAQKSVVTTPSYQYFISEVAPVLADTCSAKDENGTAICHGTEGMATDASKLSGLTFEHIAPNLTNNTCNTGCHQMTGKNKFSFGLDPKGEIITDLQGIYAFQQAKKLASYSKGPFARILRMPLSALSGGLGQYHQGGEVFDTAEDPDYQKLVEWVKIENETNGNTTDKRSPAERFFGEEVLPIYARNNCLSPACHIFNHSSFFPDVGLPAKSLDQPISERFSQEQVSYNRLTSKGLIQKIAYLQGDVEQSRVLKKNIPIDKGGIIHRGGNDQFFTGPEDPEYQTIKKWLEMEREQSVSKLKINQVPVEEADVGRIQGVVFVRTKTNNHRKYLDVGKYLPGGDLFVQPLLEGETLETATQEAINLTAQFHEGQEADVREPDVRYDGRAVLFSMRIGEEDNLNVYEIELDDNLNYVADSFRRITYGEKFINGIKVHYTDPTYVPDSSDTAAFIGGFNLEKADMVYVSNRAGDVIQSVERGTLGEADGGTTTEIWDHDRPELDGDFVGMRIYIVDGANKGEWRTITGFKNELFTKKRLSYLTVDKPFPVAIDNSSIYVIEKPEATQPGFLPSYSMYGQRSPQRGKEEQMFDATVSRITYGVAQEMDLSVRSTGEVFFSGQRAFMDKYDRPIFNIGSMRRHLDTRFSFPTHHGNRSQVLLYADTQEMPDGLSAHVGMDPDNLWEGGNLSVSDHQLGPGLEARNPHDYATGYFDVDGNPIVESTDKTNTRFKFKDDKAPTHTRFVFKKNALFPDIGPDAITRTGFSPKGIFRDPKAMPDGRLIVSYSPDPINHFDPNANPDFDLYILDPQTRSYHNEGGKGYPPIDKVKLSASAKGYSDIQAVPVFVNIKHKINAARRKPRDHLIRQPGMADNDHRPANYLERNFLLMDAIMNDPSPVGKKVAFKIDPLTGKQVEDIDKVKYVRMVEVLPTTPDLAAPLDITKVANGDPTSTLMSNGIHNMKRIVGEAPVEEDGSIYIRIPSKTPLIIQTLNKDKMTLRQEARHYFFAPNEPFTISPSPSETFQTCGACMGAIAKKENLFGPVNTFSGQQNVIAIKKSKLTPDKKPPAYGIDPIDRMSIDFERDIQPVLNAKCASCHSGDDPAAGLNLSGEKTAYYNVAYESLHQLREPESAWYNKKVYLSERNALAIESYLTEKLYGRELKAQRTLEGDKPHPSAELLTQHGLDSMPLTDEEKLLFVRWIDMGATYMGPEIPKPKLLEAENEGEEEKLDWKHTLKPMGVAMNE